MNLCKVQNCRWLLVVAIALCNCCAYTQSGAWVWMNGDTTANSPGRFGTQGITNVNNCPPGFYQAQQWTDKQGNFWLFGGVDSEQNLYSDLWEFVPSANMWTWIKGTGVSNEPAINGTMGIPSPNNRPGARSWGCSTWTDGVGDLWLFGGLGYDSIGEQGNLNDLWRYNITGNQWTWMAGPGKANLPGVYGTLQHPSDSTVPPGRSEVNCAWADAKNNLWLFGGYGYNTNPGCYNDIWRFSIANGQWAWMGGSDTLNAPGNYGVLGVEAPGNAPPARNCYVHWVDSNYLYFAGGCNFDSLSLSQERWYNDVWRFNTNNNYFTWIGGDSGDVIAGHDSHFCTSDSGDMPAGLVEARGAQLNACSPILFMCGGANESNVMSNDLWIFDLTVLKWRLISGDTAISAHGNFGTEGVSSPSNMPPGAMGLCFWTDFNGNLWLWGGQCSFGSSNNYLNTNNGMWEYSPDPSCFPPQDTGTVNITPAGAMICPGDSVQLCAPQGFSHYYWSNNDTTMCIYASVPGGYYVNCNSNVRCLATSNMVGVSYYQAVPAMVHQSGDTLTCTNTGPYQWFLNGTAILGATDSTYIAQVPGSYQVQITGQHGCSDTSLPVVASIRAVSAGDNISVFPNPSVGNWQLAVGNQLLGSIVEVFDATGRRIYKSQITGSRFQINIADASAGVYELVITSDAYRAVRKLVKL